MDLNAAKDFAHMARVNAEVAAFTRKVMTEPGPKFEPQPSSRNESWRPHVDEFGVKVRR
jgi:hypothetical protein